MQTMNPPMDIRRCEPNLLYRKLRYRNLVGRITIPATGGNRPVQPDTASFVGKRRIQPPPAAGPEQYGGMSQEAASTGPTGVYESKGSYRTNMTALGVRAGVLRATSGTPADRLTFTTDDGQVLLDAPISELHSVGLAEMNGTLEVWQADRRHRISLAPGGVLAGNIIGEFAPQSIAMQWRDYLLPLVGDPPAGVKVKKPLSRAANIWLGVGISLVILIVVLVAVILIG